MFNSGNIQSFLSSSQDSAFTQIYNHDQDPNNTLKDQENPAFILRSKFSSIIDEHQFPLSQIFSQTQASIHGDVVDQENKNNNNNSSNYPENPCKVIKPTMRRNPGPSSRRKTGKKSRHTKICTAQGVRDRRMRLSLPVARKFFDLQDLLGFDKASKTIEWLFSNSQKAIEELEMKNLPQGKDSYCSSEEDSEAKFMSNFELKSANNDVEEYPNNENDITKSRKPLFNYSRAKQYRERARARARERTREKMKSKGIKQWYESNPSKDDIEHLAHFYPFNDQSSSRTQYVQSEENDTNCTSFIGLIENLEGCKNNSTMGLATGDLDVSAYCLPARKFPFLFQ